MRTQKTNAPYGFRHELTFCGSKPGSRGHFEPFEVTGGLEQLCRAHLGFQVRLEKLSRTGSRSRFRVLQRSRAGSSGPFRTPERGRMGSSGDFGSKALKNSGALARARRAEQNLKMSDLDQSAVNKSFCETEKLSQATAKAQLENNRWIHNN